MMTDDSRGQTQTAGLVRAVLRLVAVAIALLAAVDPAITTSRARRPLVAVVPLSPTDDQEMAGQVAQALRRQLRVVSGPLRAADATVLVGVGLPEHPQRVLGDASSPTYAVSPDTSAARAVVTWTDAPVRTTVHERVAVRTALHVRGAGATSVQLVLRAAGTVVDSASLAVSSADTTAPMELSFVPADTGLTRLHVEARFTGGGRRDTSLAAVDRAVHVQPASHAVLVFDARPTWSSTFVRRALERDARLAVTSRMVTSRNLSTATGAPPMRLDDASALARFDAIVVGAPDALTASDVRGLDAFLRQRGGSVVLLLDQRASGAVAQLSGVSDWRFRSEATGIALHGAMDGAGRVVGPPSAIDWRATQIAWPASLPAGATVLATVNATTVNATTVEATTDARRPRRRELPVVWQTTVGRGQLVVGGAIDAWRYRDAATSAFDPFWQNVVASAAAAALPPLDVALPRNVVAPGEAVEFTVAVRSATTGASDIATASSSRITAAAAVEAVVGGTTRRIGIRLWPTGTPGWFRGTMRAPTVAGTAQLVVTAGDARTVLPVMVDGTRAAPTADDGTLLAAWVGAHSGRVVPSSALDAFGRELARTVRPIPRREPWHPMRSPWWLLPFALALSLEWWLRRRRGLA